MQLNYDHEHNPKPATRLDQGNKLNNANPKRNCKGTKGDRTAEIEDIYIFLFWFLWTVGREKHSIKLTDQPGNLIPLDRKGMPDLSVSGDKFDLVEVDPHDPTTTSEPVAPMQSLNQLPMVTNLAGARSA